VVAEFSSRSIRALSFEEKSDQTGKAFKKKIDPDITSPFILTREKRGANLE